MALRLSFHGGAGTVTGSRFLLESGPTRVLVDAGLFQGLKELRLLNWREPAFDPRSIDHVLLTHAHIDHSGALPRLARLGLRAPIHATAGTRELAGIMLVDSASLQEEDAEYANRKRFSKHQPALPLYTVEDARRALELFRTSRYGERLGLGPGLDARFGDAGHMLGSAWVEIRAVEGGRETTVVFSGDVGRYGAPLHPDPIPPPAADVLVVESTYGDRAHDHEPLEVQVERAFRPVLEARGTILVPAFAVGRAQVVTLVLRQLMESGRLPEVPIHVDSPMAVDATEIYSRHMRDRSLDADATPARGTRLFPENVHLHRTVEESKALNALAGPRIILSASGMLSGGRVLHHLERLVDEPANLIALVGWQAAGTRGRRMLEGERTVRVHGRDVPVRARLVALHGFSGHADRDELVRWVGSAERPPRTIFVVHGEPDASRALARALEAETGARVRVPALGDTFDL